MRQMKLIFKVEDEKKDEVNEILDEDPIARLSITMRSADSLGFDQEGSFLLLEGDEETCQEAEEELEGLAEKITGENKDEVIESIQEQEEKSMKGFGGVFGE